MHIVIDIPEEEYTMYKEWVADECANIEQTIIAEGIPLPKGHGRLIEEPTETDILNTVGGNNDFAECIRDSVKAVFDNATTIVEADKEAKNEDSN